MRGLRLPRSHLFLFQRMGKGRLEKASSCKGDFLLGGEERASGPATDRRLRLLEEHGVHSWNEKRSRESGDSGAHISCEEESISLFMARRVVCCPKRFGINDQPKWFPTVIGSSSSSSGVRGCARAHARPSRRRSLLPRVIASESITNRLEASVIKKTRARESERHRAHG